MCAAVVRLFHCCVTPRRPGPPADSDDDDAGKPPSLAADTRRLETPVAGQSSSPSNTCRCPPGCTLDADDPSTPAPVCCCEHCDGGWFPPEVSLRMRNCLLEHVTACGGARRRQCAWTGDVTSLSETEKAEMAIMSRDLKGVDPQVGHYGHISATDDETRSPSPRPRLLSEWSPCDELVSLLVCPNRTVGHLYEAVVRHQRTCTCALPDDVASLPNDDSETSPSTKSTLCCCCVPARPKRRKFWTRKKKS